MAVVTLDSAVLTGLNTAPITAAQAGRGGPALPRRVSDFITVNSGDSIASTYRLCRLPTFAKVKSVIVASMVATAGSADINIAFSDSTFDGTSAANQGTVPQMAAANNKLFGAAVSLVGTGQKVDCTFLNTTNYPVNSPTLSLWEVLGYATNPGGMFDIFLKVTTAITTGGLIYIDVTYDV